MSPPAFSISLVGGFGLPFPGPGRYYWAERAPRPEPINSHGPFLFKRTARRDARRKLGQGAVEVLA